MALHESILGHGGLLPVGIGVLIPITRSMCDIILDLLFGIKRATSGIGIGLINKNHVIQTVHNLRHLCRGLPSYIGIIIDAEPLFTSPFRCDKNDTVGRS